MQDVRDRAEYYRLRAQRKARSHYLAGRRAGRKHTTLGVPVVILSAVVGSAIFVTLTNTNPDTTRRVVAGILSIAAGTLAALQTFFRFSELAEKHRMSAAGYAALKRKLDLFQLQTAEGMSDRQQYIHALEQIVKDLDGLEKDSPDVPDDLYDQSVREQKSDREGV